MLDVEHMHRILVVELIDLAPVRLGEIGPAHFLDNHLMTQTIGLLHLGAIMIVVFGSNDVNHGHSPVHGVIDAWDQLAQASSNSVNGECRMCGGGDSTRTRTFTRSTPRGLLRRPLAAAVLDSPIGHAAHSPPSTVNQPSPTASAGCAAKFFRRS